MRETRETLTFHPHAGGYCEQCGKKQDNLFLATLSLNEKTESMALCRDCATQLKTRFDRRQAQQASAATQPSTASRPMPQPPVRQRPASSAPQAQNGMQPAKRPKKRKPAIIATAVVLAVVLVVGVVAGVAGVSLRTHKRPASAGEDTLNVSSADIRDDSSEQPEVYTIPPEDIYESKTFKLLSPASDNLKRGLFSFSEGLCWVSAQEEGMMGSELFVIDTNGNVKYCLDRSYFDSDSYRRASGPFVTPFKNGFSCVYTREPDGFLVIDRNGREVLSDFSDTYFLIGTADDGLIFLSKHVSNMTENYWCLCTVDQSMQIKETGIRDIKRISYYSYGYGGVRKISDGVYVANTGCLLAFDLNRKCYSDLMQEECYYYGMNDDYLFFSYDGEYYRIPKRDFGDTLYETSNADDNKTAEAALLEHADKMVKPENSGSSFTVFSAAHGGCLFVWNNWAEKTAVYDFQGNEIVCLDPLPEGTKLREYSSYRDPPYFGDLHNGPGVQIEGADSNIYYSAYDSDGHLLFTPVPIPYSSLGSYEDEYAGYCFINDKNKNLHILNPNGQEMTAGDAFSGIDTTAGYSGDLVSVHEGWLFFFNTFYKLDGSRSFDEITVHYDIDGNILYG